MSLYFQCETTPTDMGSNALQCASGWLSVTEPVYTLMSYEDASGLLAALLGLVTVYAVFRILTRFILNS